MSTDFLLGKAADAILPETPLDSLEYIQAYNEAMRGIGLRRWAGQMQSFYSFDRAWKKSYSKVHAFIEGYVTRVLEETV